MTVRQMTAKTLNALKGWPQMNAVDYVAKLSSTVSANDLPLPPGSVVSLNTAGDFIPGVGNDNVMPMFLFYGTDSDMISNDGGDASTDVGAWVPMTPAGQMVALVAIGAYELVSTAFVTGQTYNPNTPLTANKTGSAKPGYLRPGTINTNMIVGLVSRGKVDNGYGHEAVAFWPCPIFVQ